MEQKPKGENMVNLQLQQYETTHGVHLGILAQTQKINGGENMGIIILNVGYPKIS
jgi:hypothetical protein